MYYHFIFYFLIFLIIDYVAHNLFPAKISIKQRLFYVLIIGALLTFILKIDFKTIFKTITSYHYLDSLIKSLIIIILHFIYIKLAYKTNIKDNLIISFLSLGIITLALTIANNFYVDLMKYFLGFYYSVDSAIHFSAIIIDFLLWIIFIKIYKETKKIASFKSLFPIALITLTILSILYMINFKLTSRTILSITIIIILINYIIIYSYMRKLSDARLKAESKRLETERNYYQELAKMQSDHYDTSFNFIHNLITEVKKAKELLNNKEYQEANQQVDLVHSELIREFNIIYTNSRTISSVINAHLKEITSNDIKLKTTIKYSDFSFMDDLDATQLFDKLLTYMLNDCIKAKTSDKFININTSLISSCLVIKLIFSQNNNQDNKGSMDDIKTLVEKYGGKLIFKHEKSNDYAEINLIYNIRLMNDNMGLENQI